MEEIAVLITDALDNWAMSGGQGREKSWRHGRLRHRIPGLIYPYPYFQGSLAYPFTEEIDRESMNGNFNVSFVRQLLRCLPG